MWAQEHRLWCQADLDLSSDCAIICSMNFNKVLSYFMPQFVTTYNELILTSQCFFLVCVCMFVYMHGYFAGYWHHFIGYLLCIFMHKANKYLVKYWVPMALNSVNVFIDHVLCCDPKVECLCLVKTYWFKTLTYI